MSEMSWLDYWGLKYDPFVDFPVGSPEYRQFMIFTKSTKKVHPEIQSAMSSPIGVIKPVVGTRGSGKSSWLLNFIYGLADNQKVFSLYVNTYKSISTIKEAARTVFMERYLLNEILWQTLAKARAMNASLLEDEKWIEKVAENITTIPSPNLMPQISIDNFKDVLKVLRRKGYERFVIAIDELDKLTELGDPNYEALMAMIGDFFGTQQGFFQMLTTEYKSSIYISCDEKWTDLFKKRNLSYLQNTVGIERLDPIETEKLIRARLKPQVDIFPFSDESLEITNSYFLGNPRKLLQACRELMIEASVKGDKQIDGRMVKRLFLKTAAESFEKDFQEIAKLEESSMGARMLWRLCSKLTSREDREKALFFLAKLYRNEAYDALPEQILEVIKDCEYVRFKLPKKEAELDTKLRSFLDRWVKTGHSLDDLIGWYSEAVQRPEELSHIDDQVKHLIDAIPDVDIGKKILYAYDFYSCRLDYENQKDTVVLKSWSMLESLIKAFCLETGFRDFVLGASEERLDSEPSPHHRFRISLMELFGAALARKRIRLIQYGAINSVKELRNQVQHEQYMPNDDEANQCRKNAKLGFEEIVRKWKVGQKFFPRPKGP